jgi:hypothetical protein
MILLAKNFFAASQPAGRLKFSIGPTTRSSCHLRVILRSLLCLSCGRGNDVPPSTKLLSQ